MLAILVKFIVFIDFFQFTCIIASPTQSFSSITLLGEEIL